MLQQPKKPVAISVKGLSKKLSRSLKLSLLYGLKDIVCELTNTTRKTKLRKSEFWALQNISFDLKHGECLGVIGPNGSGKSTLLKLITGIIKPDKGSITINGKIAPLIALGAGFNPLLSGRENIFINMSILGMGAKEIKECINEVINFAELEEAIDSPLRTYSTGMAARLGFACAIHVKPEILLVDEILAVGDIKFRSKCYKKIAALKSSGTSIIVVSHNPATISHVCDRAIVINKSKFLEIGPASEIMAKYEELLLKSNDNDKTTQSLTFQKNEDTFIESINFKNKNNKVTDHLTSNENGTLSVSIASKITKKKIGIGVYFKSDKVSQGTVLRIFSNEEKKFWSLKAGLNDLEIQFEPLLMNAGMYVLKIFIFEQDPINVIDGVDGIHMKVLSKQLHLDSLYMQPKSWKIKHHAK
ncbi:MAG: ABC transporter ATP-binding protein [Alphaproteobacteria bacterium]